MSQPRPSESDHDAAQGVVISCIISKEHQKPQWSSEARLSWLCVAHHDSPPQRIPNSRLNEAQSESAHRPPFFDVLNEAHSVNNPAPHLSLVSPGLVLQRCLTPVLRTCRRKKQEPDLPNQQLAPASNFLLRVLSHTQIPFSTFVSSSRRVLFSPFQPPAAFKAGSFPSP